MYTQYKNGYYYHLLKCYGKKQRHQYKIKDNSLTR